MVAIPRGGGPTDADLVRAAQVGEVSALGLLLARHRSAMLAVAITLLGYGPDAEDAVQDATVVALRRVGDVRDPEAVGPWLRAVVRNVCRARRARHDLPLDDPLAAALRSPEPDPAEALERHALRDWVWHALEQLSPPLRLVLVLRYFTGVTTYQDIADACGVPIGTVRSRLAEARDRLARAVLATAEAAHDDSASLTSARWRRAEETLSAARRGDLGTFAAYWSPTLEGHWPRGDRSFGRRRVLGVLERDLGAGVHHHLANVVAGRDLTIWEIELVNPADDPFHCPPRAVWIHHLESGRAQRCRLFHARRPLERSAAAA
ncbi:RNA polymerase sigma factor [Micromonospora musae]|uniref:Sigma-70 family RNA polymerase sigma factor n=1 Tax=Micromonospora musae TaxID=1894970 RepID=A0A3A9YB16_9ACTN|nr:sigma-70 family RNA polymerase sigma factor [Micromonospora musae]RKN34410.1 sigma-70 family RNA polymerase sigma factor [Micromonospora musae]